MRGSIVKRGNSYSVVYRAPDSATGKMKQVWKGRFTKKREAEAYLREVVNGLEAGTYVKPSTQTVHQYLVDDWLPSLEALVAGGKLRPTTAASYRNLVELHVLPRIGGAYLRTLDGPALNKLYGQLLTTGGRRGSGVSTTTVHLVHVTISRALKDAVRWGKLSRNVAAQADPPRPRRMEMSLWSAEQLRAFLERLRDDRLFAMWLLFATTGMRRGEVIGLSWDDIDLDAGRLHVRHTRVVVAGKVHQSKPKTEKGRRALALDPVTISTLRAHRLRQLQERMAWEGGWQDTGLVFTREDGSGLHPNAITFTFHRHARAAGLPPIPLHGLRHSYATAALEAGQDIKVVSGRLGHSSIGITGDLYQHVTERLDQQAADGVANYILSGAGQPAR